MFFRKSPNIIPSQAIDEAKKVSLPRLWPYRLIGNMVILMTIVFSCLGILIVKSNFVSQKLISLSDYFFQFTSYIGFTVDDVLVYGRQKTPITEVNNIVGSRYGENILTIDIHQLKQDLQQLPWVKSVTVERSYFPNIIKINLREKQVKSLWQMNNRFYPIDADGQIIQTGFIPNKPMLLIVGKGAPDNINFLLDTIQEDEELYNRIKVANFISERRWDVTIDDIENGITIKLPQEDFDKAWSKLIKLNKTMGILKRKLTIIDLRFDNKVMVKPRKLSTDDNIKIHTGPENKI